MDVRVVSFRDSFAIGRSDPSLSSCRWQNAGQDDGLAIEACLGGGEKPMCAYMAIINGRGIE